MQSNPSLRLPLCGVAGAVLIAFSAGLYNRLKLAKFAPLKSLTLTNKYYVLSISSGIFAITCLSIFISRRWNSHSIFCHRGLNHTQRTSNISVAGCSWWNSNVRYGYSLFQYTVGLFASIYRYERIASVYRGTILCKVFQFVRCATIFLGILSTASFITFMVSAFYEVIYTDDFWMLYTVMNGTTAAWMMIIDLVLGIRMTILVLESIRTDKISHSLKPKLLGTMAFIILNDLLTVVLSSLGAWRLVSLRYS